MKRKITKVIHISMVSLLLLTGNIRAMAGTGLEVFVTKMVMFPTLAPTALTVLTIAGPCAVPGLPCDKDEIKKYKLQTTREAQAYALQSEQGIDDQAMEQFIHLNYLANKSGRRVDEIVVAALTGQLKEIGGLEATDIYYDLD